MEVGEISGVREFLKVDFLGHGCSTAVEHISCNQEVVGLNPAVGFFSSFPTFAYQWSVFNRVSQGGASLTVCCKSNKNGFLALLPGAKQSQ